MKGVEELADDDVPPILPHPFGKKSNDPEVQLANYALEQLSSDEFRSWTTSILINDDELTLWYYDRTMAVATKPIKFKEDQENFILLVAALVKASMSPKSMGFSENFTSMPKIPSSAKKPRTSSSSTKKPGKCSSSKEETKEETEKIEYRYLYVKDLDKYEKLEEMAHPSLIDNRIPALLFNDDTVLRIEYRRSLHCQYTLFGRATRVERIHLGHIGDDGELICLFDDHYGSQTGDGRPPLILKISNQVMS